MHLATISALALAASAVYAGYSYFSHSPFLSIAENYRGKCVWVTGASSGIGKALALELFKAGAQVCLSSRDAATLQAVIDTDLAAARRSVSIDPYIVAFDVAEAGRDDAVAKSVVSRVLAGSKTGKIDAVILNAGVSVRGSTLEMDSATHRAVFDVNVFGPVALCRSLVSQDGFNKNGSIVVVSSVQGKLPLAFRGAYSASKHAVQAYFDSIRLELEPMGITVTTVLPGYVATSLSKNALTPDGSKHNQLDETTSKGMQPKDLARQILCSLDAKEPELWVAPLPHKAAMALYNVCPTLVRQFLRSKARKEALSSNK